MSITSADALPPTQHVALSWVLGLLGLGPPTPTPPWSRQYLRTSPLSGARLTTIRAQALTEIRSDGDELQIGLRDPRGNPWLVRLRFDHDTIVSAAYGWPLPAEFDLRPCTAEQASQLAEVERDAPVTYADGSVLQIFRPRLRDLYRLQEDHRMAVIAREGRAVAARAWALRTVELGGRQHCLGTSQIARVLPAVRGANLMRAFCLWETEAVEMCLTAWLAYIDVGNLAPAASFQSSPFEWRRRVLELTFDCSAIARPTPCRYARPDDADLLARWANLAHGGEALYPLQDASCILRRMERAPDVYSWRDVLIGQGAALGVWACLDESEFQQTGHAARRRRLAIALDHGWRDEAGADEMAALIGAQAHRVLPLGATHLQLYTYPGSPLALRLEGAAQQATLVAVQSDLAEPGELKGIYSDPLYV